MNPIPTTDALAAGRAIADGTLTAHDLVSACLERIREREPDVLAWKHLDAEAALAEAAARDAERPRSPLHGVPVGVKDVIDTADMPTGYGSPIHEGARPAADAACVALLRAAGMVVLGKTVTTEFALRHPGATRNPHDPGHTPGGSSSGSAAAVGAGMVPLAIGTQTAGSVIRPAAYCGVVGFKPSYGTVPRAGLKMLAESLDTIGTMAHSAADAAAFVRAMAGLPVTAPAPADAPPRLGLCRSPAWPEIEPAGEQALLEAARLAERAGARVVEVELPAPFADALWAQDTIMPYEAARMLAWERETNGPMLSEPLSKVLAAGLDCPPADYRRARRVQAACRAAIADLFGTVDCLLTPAAPGEAPKGLGWTGNPVFNRLWTLTGVPCVSVPGLTGPTGLPVGIQLVGPLDDDDRVIAAADWLRGVLAGV